MVADASLVWALERNLEKACTLHQRYLDLLSKERASLKTFASTDVEKIRTQREDFLRSIEETTAARQELLANLPGGNTEKLSKLLETEFAPRDAARLLPRVEELRRVATAVQRESREFSQVVNFALNLVHGSLSILWSATQDVTRSYTQGGALREKHTPSRSRAQNLRCEA